MQKLELKQLHSCNGTAEIEGDEEEKQRVSKLLKDYYTIDPKIAMLCLPNPPHNAYNSKLKNRIKDVGRFCELYQKDFGFRSGGWKWHVIARTGIVWSCRCSCPPSSLLSCLHPCLKRIIRAGQGKKTRATGVTVA